jgi:predicted SnoaL-like aldol condensation-catalyzing enzyme
MTDKTETNVALAEQWAQTFNSDVETLISDLYSPECLFTGVKLGHDKLLRFERRVLAAAPRREIRIDKTHAIGDVVTVEGVLLDPDQGADWKLPFCAVLTWRDGKVVSDNTYADMSRWPGVRS